MGCKCCGSSGLVDLIEPVYINGRRIGCHFRGPNDRPADETTMECRQYLKCHTAHC